MTDSVEVEMEEQHTKEEINDESKKEEQDDSWKQKSKSSFYQGEIIEGKREKKTVQRLDMQVAKPKEKPKVESIGTGDKLGDIARVNHAIGRLKAPLLKPLHKILYDRPGAVSSLRKNLRLFNGFPFEVDSDPYTKKREKMARLPKVQLKTICQILDLERSGIQAVLVDRIMHFLVNPKNSGKPVKKKRKKKTTKDSKREKKTASKSKKQQLESGKSKAIVTDSSSDDELDDDEDDEEDEVENKNKDKEKSPVSEGEKKEDDESGSEEEVEKSEGSDESPEDSEDEEKSKSKKPASKKKSTPKKATKKVEDASDQSDQDNDSAEDAGLKKTKKRPAAQKKVPVKPIPKTKKADSSSNRKKNTASKTKVLSDSSDDDEPLIKMVKKPPTNDQLKGAVKDLLKNANLEEVTMKQICQQVYDLYPDFDLTNRKDFIKDTVKSLIS